MYKRLLLCGLLFSLVLSAWAQSFKRDAPKSKQEIRQEKNACRPYYVGISTGINNPGGLLGLSLDYNLSEHATLRGQVGLGTWGAKTSVMYNYFRRPCHKGWNYGAGITFATGNRNNIMNLQTPMGYKDISVNLLPQLGIQLSFLKVFPLGKQGNRLLAGLGWNQRITRKVYTVNDGNTLTLRSDRFLNAICPGGLTISAAYQIGVGGKKKRK